MPTYCYQCQECGHSSERVLRIADRNQPVETPCEECQKEAVQMVIKPVLFNADALPKLSNDYKYLMRSIKKANRGSNMPDY